MLVVDWDSYFMALSAFAGVVFAITLAARQIRSGDEAGETKERNSYRLWDSVAVTYELAAAGFFGMLYFARSASWEDREPWLVGGFSTVLAIIGWALYVAYFVHLCRLIGREKVGVLDWLMAPVTVVPMTAFVVVPIAFWDPSSVLWTDWFAAALTWLVFSGTTQALIWYITAWERKPDPESTTEVTQLDGTGSAD